MNRKTRKIESQDQGILSGLTGLTAPQVLFRRAEGPGADKVAVRDKAYGIWHSYNWREYLEYVRYVCLGLLSLGLQRGEKIGLVIDNRPEWLFSELGAQAAGGCTINLSTSTMAGALAYDLSHLDASYVFVEDRRQVEKVLAHRETLYHVKRVIFIDPANMMTYKDDPWLLSFGQLLELGRNMEAKEHGLFTRELWQGSPEDTAMILMTSGIRGMQKPAMISHKNLMETSVRWLENISLVTGDNWVSISPAASVLEETWCIGIALGGGVTINFPETPRSLLNDMREIGPSVIAAYPGFWEYLMSLIKTDIEDSRSLRKRMFNRSFETGRAVYELEAKGLPVPLGLKCLHRLLRMIVTVPLMDRIGLLGVRHAYTGGSPISPEVVKFFRFSGLALKQCYGLAETAGMFQFQDYSDMSPDTAGKPLPGTDISVSVDGEILVSGGFVFSGYYKDPETTSNVLKDGLLHTGDIGCLDKEGRLIIIGRKEDIIRAEDGRVFSRDFIETRLKESPFIKDAVIWGKEMPYLIAFIGVDFENTMRWAKRHNIVCNDYVELTGHAATEDLIKKEVHDLNLMLPRYMHIRKFALINKELDTDEELTKTGIARRKFLFEQYMDILKAMYTDEPEALLKVRLRYVSDDIRTINTRIGIITVPEGGSQL